MPPIKEEGYATFSRRLHQKAQPSDRTPVCGTLELTRRCNFSCIHCYNNLPADDPKARRKELDFGEYRRILDQIAEAGTLWLLLTGGEVFLRPDFMQIYRYAKENGFLITIFTNGSGMTEALADELVKYRPFALEITIYGHTRETHERLTRRPGSFARVQKAIRLLTERGLPLKLKTMVIKENRHELEAMMAFADELGLEFKFDGMINPRLGGSKAPLGTRLEPIEVVALDLLDDRRSEEWAKFCDYFNGPPQLPGREDRLYNCGGGVSSFAVNPEGKLALCSFSDTPEDLYDLRKNSFSEGWEFFLSQIVDRRISRTTRCTRCHIKALCGMCPALAQLEEGDREEPVEFMCHVAHLRAAFLGFNIPPHGDCPYCPGGEHFNCLCSETEELKKRESSIMS